jgi:hydrogenase maturation factor
MITQKTITVDGKEYTVNVCDLSTKWVLIHNGTKALACDENERNSKGKLETVNTIFEAATKEDCKVESTRLGLTGFDELFPVPKAKPSSRRES